MVFGPFLSFTVRALKRAAQRKAQKTLNSRLILSMDDDLGLTEKEFSLQGEGESSFASSLMCQILHLECA